MSYDLVPGIQQDQWSNCIDIIRLYEGAYGQREDAKGGVQLRDIVNPEEITAIIGKSNVNAKELLIEYCQILEEAHRKDPQGAVDRMSDVGMLKDFENFKKDRQHLKEVIREANSLDLIEEMEMDSIAGEELKPGAIDRSVSLKKTREEASKAEIEKALNIIQIKNDAEMPASNEHLVNRIARNSQEIQKIAQRMTDKTAGPAKVDAELILKAEERQKGINKAIQREKAYRFYETDAGRTMLKSFQQSMAWVSAKAAGRKSPDENDRKLAAETIKKLKDAHAYGKRKFTIELVLTKARSEQIELKKNSNFVPLKASEVFTKKKQKLSRAQDGRYSAKQEKALKGALDTESKRRQKDIDKDKNKK